MNKNIKKISIIVALLAFQSSFIYGIKPFGLYDPKYTGLKEALREIENGNKDTDYVIGIPGFYAWKGGFLGIGVLPTPAQLFTVRPLYKDFFNKKQPGRVPEKVYNMYKNVEAKTIAFNLPTRDLLHVSLGGEFDARIVLYPILKLIRTDYTGKIILFGHSRGGAALLAALDMVANPTDPLYAKGWAKLGATPEEIAKIKDKLSTPGVVHYVSAPLLTIKEGYASLTKANVLKLGKITERKEGIDIIGRLSGPNPLFGLHFYMIDGDDIVKNIYDDTVRSFCDKTNGRWKLTSLAPKHGENHFSPKTVYEDFAAYLSKLSRMKRTPALRGLSEYESARLDRTRTAVSD